MHKDLRATVAYHSLYDILLHFNYDLENVGCYSKQR